MIGYTRSKILKLGRGGIYFLSPHLRGYGRGIPVGGRRPEAWSTEQVRDRPKGKKEKIFRFIYKNSNSMFLIPACVFFLLLFVFPSEDIFE